MALAVVSLTLISFFEYNLSPNLNLLFFIFLGSITGYNFVKYAGIAKLQHSRLAGNLKLIQIFSLFCFIGLVFISFKQNIKVLALSAILGLFTMLYAAPILKNKRNLRNIAGFKIFIIALVWAGVSVLLPLIIFEEISNWELLILFIQRLFFVIVITLPFEIRDLDFDASHLQTIPQQFGIKKTKIFGLVLMLIIFTLEFLKINQDILNTGVLSIVLIVTAGFLLKSGKGQGRYYSSFWVESIPIMWLGILVLFRYFV